MTEYCPECGQEIEEYEDERVRKPLTNKEVLDIFGIGLDYIEKLKAESKDFVNESNTSKTG